MKMRKNKKAIIGGTIGAVLAIGIVSTGGVIAYANLSQKPTLNDGAASIAASDNTAANTPQTSSASVSNAGSSVSQQMGQLNVSQNSGQQGTSVQGTTRSNSSSSNTSNSTPTIDPSTFAQYDQYKDPQKYQHVLFADVKVGTGATAGANQKAAVYYKGWLTNGQMFDQSRTGSDGKLTPFIFTLGAHQVITGWEEGVLGMKVGGTRLLVVPPAAGYGAAGQGSIPGNSVLVFEVQLLDVQ